MCTYRTRLLICGRCNKSTMVYMRVTSVCHEETHESLSSGQQVVDPALEALGRFMSKTRARSTMRHNSRATQTSVRGITRLYVVSPALHLSLSLSLSLSLLFSLFFFFFFFFSLTLYLYDDYHELKR